MSVRAGFFFCSVLCFFFFISFLKHAFDKARSQLPCIIFFDEFDSMFSTRQVDQDRLQALSGLLKIEMDGLNTASGGNSQVMCIATTNNPWDIDVSIRARFNPLFAYLFLVCPVY
jgi:ribosome biogenesis ATPase